MSEQPSFDEIMTKVDKLWDTGKQESIQSAYDLITEAVPGFPDDARVNYISYNYRYCAATLLNKPDLALEIFQEALDAGYWWTEEYLRSNSDLDSLQGLPEFNQLVEAFKQKLHVPAAETEPELLPLPLPAPSSEPFPLLLALHGNTGNAKNSVTYWENAVEEGWLIALPQFSQPVFNDGYVWDDLELGGREIKDHYQELSQNHQIYPNQVVIGGFSKGGEMAVWLPLMEIIPVAGFIAVNPGDPFIADLDKWLPLIENCKRLTEMRGFFLAGENDANRENIKKLSELLSSHGMSCEFVVAPDIAHDFPEDFNQILAKALEFVG